jgi:UDP-GlcNAc:undecaprenyl-phosphate/decaprenyl-phosphate GlcNAc-1-phosphate transferase
METYLKNNLWLIAWVVFLSSLVIALMVVPKVIKAANSKNLLDVPNARKMHTLPVPTLGGIGIFLAMVFVLLPNLFTNYGNSFSPILIALSILFIVGIVDDMHDIKASVKFIFQTFTALIVAYSGVRVESLHGLFDLYELPLAVQYAVTVVLMVGVTNSINLLDGINGLAGGIVFVNGIITAACFLWMNDFMYSVLAASLSGSLLGFLRYNFNKAKIFMGDTGSLVIGFTLSVLAITLYNKQTVAHLPTFPIVYSILILPAFDTLRVFVLRSIKGKSPFSADKNHIHHLLIKTGYDHKRSALIMYIANLLLISVGFAFSYFNFSGTVSLFYISILSVLLSEGLSIKRFFSFREKSKGLTRQLQSRLSENHLLLNIFKK